MFSVIIIGQIEKSEFLNKLSNCSQIGEILLFNNKRNDIQNISAKIKCLNLDVLPNCLGGGNFLTP